MINRRFPIFRRQKEQEAKIVEEETVKRIEEMVAQRVAEELEKRKDEIEAEVLRRVEEAKQIMEQQMLEELERRRKERLEEEKRREVLHIFPIVLITYLLRFLGSSSSSQYRFHPHLDLHGRRVETVLAGSGPCPYYLLFHLLLTVGWKVRSSSTFET